MERQKQHAVIGGGFTTRSRKKYIIAGLGGVVVISVVIALVAAAMHKDQPETATQAGKTCPASMFKNVEDGAKLAAIIQAKPNYESDLDCVYYLASYNSTLGNAKAAQEQITYLESHGGKNYTFEPAITGNTTKPSLDGLKQTYQRERNNQDPTSGEITGQEF